MQSPTMEMTNVSDSFDLSAFCTGRGVPAELLRSGIVIGSFARTLQVMTVTQAPSPMAITSMMIRKIPDLESFMASPFQNRLMTIL